MCSSSSFPATLQASVSLVWALLGLIRFPLTDCLRCLQQVLSVGYGYCAAVEEAEPADVEMLFATNVHGPVELIQRVLPGMREHGSGTMVNVSSIAANVRPAGSGFYTASKAALEGISGAALAEEVGPLGIRVIAVEPSGFRTDFAGRSLTQSEAAISAYADTAGKRRKEHDRTHGT
ncbi:SDR family NAD(P)-dependent oxidoreductase [Streptomyces spinoverrucosus]|uniref:SDR family NAD(P)-dependent oxidoreductase n=1 Tax=Streptomyces spinoverrucosus TaxID=284043 RepID=UPI0027D9E6CA|nr:SDR family NAD(P)-dependent oxidoreductase [Streptomyces spinoverrucosus]